MRQLMPACLALALLLATVSTVQAQGINLPKKAADKIVGKKPDSVATTGKPAKPKCDASHMVITGDVVGGYLKGVAARDAEMQRLAKQPGKTGAYYSALLQRQAVERRKAEYELHRGPDWEKEKALQKRLRSGDGSAIQEENALQESLNPNRVQVPELEWEDQQKGNAQMDSTMRVAAGLTECDWTDLGERLPRLVYLLADDPNAKDLQGLGTSAEAAAVRTRLPELAAAMHLKYVSAEDKARLAKEKEAQEQEAPSTGNAQQDCMVKAQQAWVKAHQAELDAAQQSHDMNAIMQLNAELQKAMAKCN